MAPEKDDLDTKNYGKPRQYDPYFKGPVKNRSCTDVICLILLLVFLGGWGAISYFAFANGSWDRLIHPTDSRGKVCGKKHLNGPDLSNRPYLLYFDLSKCTGPQVLFQGCRTPSVCVEKCPSSVWTDQISGTTDVSNLICMDGINKTQMASLDGSRTRARFCASYYFPSIPIAGRCMPDFGLTISNGNTRSAQLAALVDFQPVEVNGETVTKDAIVNGTESVRKFLNLRDTMEKVFQDFSASWWMILIAFGCTMVISFIWIILMRWIAGPMVWLGMVAVVGLLSYAVYYCFSTRDRLKKESSAPDPPFEFTIDVNSYLTRTDTWLAFGIIAAVVLGIIVLIAIFLRNRIRLAIALLQEASKGVSHMIFTLLFPIIPFVLQLAVFGFWGLLAILFASAGEQNGVLINSKNMSDTLVPCDLQATPNTTGDYQCVFGDYSRETKYTYFQLYNVFGLFWLGFFVVGLSEMALAGAFASFYWTRNKAADLPNFPLGASFGRVFRYHLGSIAFGALIIAVVRFIRWLLEQLDQKLRKSNLGIARFFLKCCACCLWCLEKFLKFINKNAYIMIAIYGKNFCWSAKEAFMLLMRNIVRVVVLDKVTDFLLFLGKLVVVGAVGVGSFFFFARRIPGLEHIPPKLTYYYVPVITVILGSYLIASAFFGVYAMAVDTLFLCFLEDLERNDGSEARPYFMSKNLMIILGKKNRTSPKKSKSKTTIT